MNARKAAALRAMAEQSASPEEAEIARRELAELQAKDATYRDPFEPCGICGRLPRKHFARPPTDALVILLDWHEYVPEWEVAWGRYQEHQRVADELARQAEERQIAELVRRWEHGTYRGMTVGGGATGPRLGKA